MLLLRRFTQSRFAISERARMMSPEAFGAPQSPLPRFYSKVLLGHVKFETYPASSEPKHHNNSHTHIPEPRRARRMREAGRVYGDSDLLRHDRTADLLVKGSCSKWASVPPLSRTTAHVTPLKTYITIFRRLCMRTAWAHLGCLRHVSDHITL